MRRLAPLVAIAIIVAACSGGDTASTETTVAAPTSTTTTSTSTTTTAPAETTQPTADSTDVLASDSGLGTILTDAEGNVLYLFIPDDGSGESTCYDGCAAAWPPLLGEPAAGDGVDAALLGTTTRTDGATQVTYNDWPLYYFANDEAPGDTNGQGLNEVWFVVSPDGTAITDAG